jgi:branched-chain amino acid aminotransferase
MHKLLFHNDGLLPIDRVRLSPGQEGLLNGWGLFTTVRAYDGMPFAFERHWNRLVRDADRIQLPLQQTPSDVRHAIEEVIRANNVQSGCIRVYLIYNKVGIWHSNEPFPIVDLIIYSTDLPGGREDPVRLAVMPHGRHAANPLTGTKVTAWLNNVWHLEQAHKRGFEEVILLNEHAEVAECTAANIFCVRSDAVCTPPRESGCLLGVTREILLEITAQTEFNISERRLTLQEFFDADEVFITSTTRGVQPVQQIEDRHILRGFGPITKRLAESFSNYVKDYFARTKRSPLS